MTTRDDEKLQRVKAQRSKEAIDLAMQARWTEAADVNLELTKDFPNDVDSFNRLGRAYMELGKYTLARGAYSRAQALDPYNAIAARNLRRLNDLSETDNEEVETDRVEPHQFIEELGKSGVVALHELSPKEDRARMVAGDRVTLRPDGGHLSVFNSRGVYMGKVDTKFAPRLVRLMAGGNEYAASVVKSVMDMMTIIIRETYQHPSQAGKLSFPPKGMEEFRAFAGDRKVEDDDEEDDSGYTIVGGEEEGEVLASERDDMEDNDTGNEDD
jgi:hypothetical protein